MAQLSTKYMQNRLEHVARELGWITKGGVKTPGYTFIQRANMDKPYFRIAQVSNTGGGERNLTDNMSRRELDIWFSGVLHACHVFEDKGKRAPTVLPDAPTPL